MSITYGFYNSVSGDRRYNAEDISTLVDGILNDGVFSTIGDKLNVLATSGMVVSVGKGRAWFKSTWTNNDAAYPLTIEQSETILNRIDAVVVEVNGDNTVRANTIKVIKGTPASSPTNPVMIKTEKVNQYPLAYIYIAAGATSIIQSNITSKIGSAECPLTGGDMSTLQTQIDTINNTSLPSKLDNAGDGKDVTVTFVAGTDTEIASGQNLATMFGKLLTKLRNVNTNLTNVINGTTKVTPIPHSTTASTYGLGTTANYGHVKTLNSLIQSSYVDGLALNAYQGKILNDRLVVEESRHAPKYVTLTSSGSWTVPAGVYEIDVLLIGGGAGGSSGYGNNYGGMSGSGGQTIFAPHINVTPGQVIPYTIGAGGNPISGSDTVDKYGGNTTFNNIVARGGLCKYAVSNYTPLGFWGWYYFIIGGVGAPIPDSDQLSYNMRMLSPNGTSGAAYGATDSSAGMDGKSCIIPVDTIGKAYTISSGGGGGLNTTYNGGLAGPGGGNGGTVSSPTGKNATQPGCSGGGGFAGIVNTGGYGFRGEIFIRYC